jgi:hypothetical protein
MGRDAQTGKIGRICHSDCPMNDPRPPIAIFEREMSDRLYWVS